MSLENGMKKLLLICALFLAALAPLPAAAALSVDVTQGNIQPLPIAIPDLISADPAQTADGRQYRRRGARRSRPLGPVQAASIRKAFVEHITNINVAPNFANWRAINAQGLVAGQVTHAARRPAARRIPAVGRLSAKARCWASNSSPQPENWRRIAHHDLGRDL